MNGTFRILKDPFKDRGQLLSIHAFVQQDGQRKQFSLAFAVMSRKTKADYVAVLEAVKNKLQNPAVESFVLDFEKGAWQAVCDVFPLAAIQGCVFHWTQAVWRHVQELGLSATYRQNGGMHNYIRLLLALPFLPPGHVLDAFNNLRERATTAATQQLVEYIDRQWMRNTVFAIADWCVFEKTVKTNNDCEGWHNRLNFKAARQGLTFYRLVPLLRREAENAAIKVTAQDLERETNRRYTKLEDKLQDAWHAYLAKDITTTHFLKTVSRCYAPTAE